MSDEFPRHEGQFASDEQAVIDIARLAERRGDPIEIDAAKLYAVRGPDGVVDILDLDGHRLRPERKMGHVRFFTAGSFGEYVQRHSIVSPDDEGATEATIWGDVERCKVVAVLDDHSSSLTGWGDHRAELTLRPTPSWLRWMALNNKLGDQTTFAEHIEESTPEIVSPDGATMLELAQSFHAVGSSMFVSDQRLSSGEVKMRWEEAVTASAGKTGELTIPTTFEVGLQPFEGASNFRVVAHLRYRVREGKLSIGYKLERPEDILRTAFDEVLEQIAGDTGLSVWSGAPRENPR